MMTNQEALLTFRAGFSCLDVSLEEVMNTIQLDAFKAGAEWASKIADDYQGKGLDSTTYYDQGGDGELTKREIRDEILSASSNLKEIPK